MLKWKTNYDPLFVRLSLKYPKDQFKFNLNKMKSTLYRSSIVLLFLLIRIVEINLYLRSNNKRKGKGQKK